jgi:hypothetical protein
LTLEEQEHLKLQAARHALNVANCPAHRLESLSPVLARFLSVSGRGVIVVTGGRLKPSGRRWTIDDGDEAGTPSTIYDMMGSGQPLPMPISRLIEEVQLAGVCQW